MEDVFIEIKYTQFINEQDPHINPQLLIETEKFGLELLRASWASIEDFIAFFKKLFTIGEEDIFLKI